MVCVPHWWTTFINMHSSTFKLSLFFFVLLFAFFCLTHCSRAGNRNLISSRTSQSKRMFSFPLCILFILDLSFSFSFSFSLSTSCSYFGVSFRLFFVTLICFCFHCERSDEIPIAFAFVTLICNRLSLLLFKGFDD